MILFKKIQNFGANWREKVQIWKTYCRSVLEQSAVLWQGALTQENRETLERTQKTFAKLLLKNNYKSYEQSLQTLDLPALDARQNQLTLQFAKKCIQNGKMAHLFPLKGKKHDYLLRNNQKYKIQFANTERLQKSQILFMQRLLNEEDNQKPVFPPN